MGKFEQLVEKNKGRDKEIKEVVDMLCAKGIANGTYQDYVLLCDVLSVLDEFIYCTKINENNLSN